jgi:hypothetical protein
MPAMLGFIAPASDQRDCLVETGDFSELSRQVDNVFNE